MDGVIKNLLIQILSKVYYENSGMFCDPHFNENSERRNCYYGKDSFDYLFEFYSKFLDLYKNERKIVSLYSYDAHEGTFEQIKYIDNSLHNFLIEILTKYFDDKSIIFLMSDHGNGMPGIYDILRSEDKKFENLFGFLFLILPKNSNYTKNLIINEKRMIIPYDIYGTFNNIIYSDLKKKKYPKSFKGQSIFEKINGKKRICKKYIEFGKNNRCACKNY